MDLKKHLEEQKKQPTKKSTQVVTSVKDFVKKYESNLLSRLPVGADAEKFKRSLYTELEKNKDLQECAPSSVLSVFSRSVEMGLEIGNILGHCYAIPFNDKKTGKKHAQFILGYKGMIALAFRSGIVVEARAVRSGDNFEFELGLHPKIYHKPKLHEKGDAKNLIAVYAVARFNNMTQFIVLDMHDIEQARSYSQTGSYSTSPWARDFESMAKKTAIKRLFNYLPITTDIQMAVERESLEDAGIIEQEIDITDDVTEETNN